MSASKGFTDGDIDVEVRGADAAPLIRLFRHPGAAYDLPHEDYRNGRFDPPPGDKNLFATLYTADNIAAAAMECRVLQANSRDEYSYTLKRAGSYKVVRFKYSAPALFIRLDRDIMRKLGIPPFTMDYLPFQRAAKALFERYGNTVHGLSWESYHRGQPGRNYGFWHHRKGAITLETLQQETDCPQLLKDDDWLQLLRDYPAIELQPDDDPASAAAPAVPAPAAKAAPKRV